MQARANDYVKQLASNNRYPLCIWPPHCLIGTWGHNVVEPLNGALSRWEDQFAFVDYVTKGSNMWTEHYSAIKADVPDPVDTTTDLNEPFIKTLKDADIILLSGEARSHCLANTVYDIADEFDKDSNELVKKMHLLTDATTDVADPPGTTMFTDMGEAFIKNMTGRGMQLTTTEEFLR
jgi:nicotinamidase-related amidase